MNIQLFTFNPFQENTYVLWDDEKAAIIIDPGCYEKYELAELDEFITNEKLTVVGIVNTHCHIDHVLGNDPVKNKYKCGLWVPENEKQVLQAIPSYAPSYGFAGYKEAEVDTWYGEGKLNFGHLSFSVIEVPGHSPGHMVLYHEPTKTLIGGDVLFRGSIGRTDLPGGNHEQLLHNIRTKVYTLPEEVMVYPGHGPTTTIGAEKRTNPFVRA